MIQHKTFKGENFSKFQGFVAIHKSFAAKLGGVASFGSTSEQSAKVLKVFSFESFPLHGTDLTQWDTSSTTCMHECSTGKKS